MRLGWRLGRPNDFTSPDKKPLRDAFGEIQRFMTWPHVALETSPAFAVGAAATVTVSWTSEIQDPYTLHAAGSTDIRVPTDFDTWLAVGAATGASDFAGGAAQRRLEWYLNGALTGWYAAAHFSAVGVRLNAALFQPVSKGDILTVKVTNGGGAEDWNADAAVFFLPLV